MTSDFILVVVSRHGHHSSGWPLQTLENIKTSCRLDMHKAVMTLPSDHCLDAWVDTCMGEHHEASTLPVSLTSRENYSDHRSSESCSPPPVWWCWTSEPGTTMKHFSINIFDPDLSHVLIVENVSSQDYGKTKWKQNNNKYFQNCSLRSFSNVSGDRFLKLWLSREVVKLLMFSP